MGKVLTVFCVLAAFLAQAQEPAKKRPSGPPAWAPQLADDTAPAASTQPAGAPPAAAPVPPAPSNVTPPEQANPASPASPASRISGAPVRRPGEPPEVITDYWRHINDILAGEAARRDRYDRAPAGKYPPPRSFAFDSFQHLKASDLMRAVVGRCPRGAEGPVLTSHPPRLIVR